MRMLESDTDTPPAQRAASEPVLVRHGAGIEFRRATALLSGCSQLYPGFEHWLDMRTLEVTLGQAQCVVAMIHQRPVGICINTPKTATRHKLSTVYVDPTARCRGIGRRMLTEQARSWYRQGVTNYYVTVREDRAEALARLCWYIEMQPVAFERDRYGNGEHEIVLARRVRSTWLV
jgi:ribosomal protein S18 acetylase RimI-like enzyme